MRQVAMHRFVCLLAVFVALAAMTPQAWGSSITLASDTLIGPPWGINGQSGADGDPFDISAAGNLDWVVSVVDEKAGASVIATGGTTGVFPIVNYTGIWDGPNFSWSDGTVTPVSADSNSGLNIAFNYYGSSPTLGTTLALPAGTGTLTVWWSVADTVYAADFDVWLDDGPSYNSPTISSGAFKTVLSWQTDTAQMLTFQSVSEGTCVFGMAVSEVPEPSAFAMLGILGVCLGGYVCRKRRRA